MSLTEPMPSQPGHMPPVIVKERFSALVASPLSTFTWPTPLTEATLKENA